MREVRVGQQYRKADGVSRIWEVIAFAPDLNGIRHCYIMDVGDRTNIRLIAEATLMKRRFYRLHAEPVASLEPAE
jgi:hypothetical protein